MGWFDETLVLLKKAQDPELFLLDLHQTFAKMNLVLEIGEDEFIVFNDTQDQQEKEVIQLNDRSSVDEVIHLLCQWPGLGVLSYRHPAFDFPLTIDYRTWDDKQLDGFVIAFNGHEVLLKQRLKEQILLEIIGLVDYNYVVGDIGKTASTPIDLNQNMVSIMAILERQSFDFDLRG